MDLTNMRMKIASAGLPGRYASALFDLADSANALDATSHDLASLDRAIGESADLRALLIAPQIARADAGRAMAALGQAMGLSDLVGKFLGTLAQNGRLAILPAVIRQYAVMLAARRGTSVAHVTAAHTLSPAQESALKASLQARTGHDMALDIRIDPAVIGGLIVRIGSEQIDSTIRTRLERLGQQMKGQ